MLKKVFKARATKPALYKNSTMQRGEFGPLIELNIPSDIIRSLDKKNSRVDLSVDSAVFLAHLLLHLTKNKKTISDRDGVLNEFSKQVVREIRKNRKASKSKKKPTPKR